MRIVAAIIFTAFISYLFWRDLRRPDRDSISWVPFVWMFIAGSRFVSRWFDLQPSGNALDGYAEGSPLDRTVFMLLILWGSVTLYRRQISWSRLLAGNKWLVAYFLYCLLSMTWSEEPQILAKRWAKDLGNPIVALVMLTEQRPYEAIVLTLRRLAFVWMPLSILFIRWYPEFGRAYSPAGAVMYSGVADQKNTLGLSCLVVGISCAWKLLMKRDAVDRYDFAIAAMVGWLLYMSNSKTSLACFVAAAFILVYAARSASSQRPTRLITATLLGVALYTAGDSLLNVTNYAFTLLGRDQTLTNRTEIWSILLSFRTNPFIGTGFMSFWTGDRMRAAWTAIGSPINQAHNGYLEQYLNLGYIGVSFIGLISLAAIVSVRRHLKEDYAAGVLRFCFIVTALLYNYTEASFYGINNIWLLFLVACIDLSKFRAAGADAVVVRRAAANSEAPHRRRRVASTSTLSDTRLKWYARHRRTRIGERHVPLVRRL